MALVQNCKAGDLGTIQRLELTGKLGKAYNDL